MNATDEYSQPMLIGAYTEHMSHVDGHAEGILVARLDTRTAALSLVGTAARVRNPAWLTRSPDGTRVYAVSEVDESDEGPTGLVTAFALDLDRATLAPINTVSSGGASPTHLSVDPSGRFLVVANFNSGTVRAIGLDAGGALSTVTDTVRHHGSSLDPVRQSEPHPHQVVFDPLTGELLVPDLGLDLVVRYRLGDDGTLATAGDPIVLAAGSGPRHIAFGPGGRTLLVLGELDSTVTVLRRGDDGDFAVTQRISTLPAGFASRNLTAGFVASLDGALVFATNRGDDSIAVFGWDERGASGQAPGLRLTQRIFCGGREPRALAISPDGRHLLVANQNTDEVVAFAIEDSRLRQVGSIGAASPACLLFSDPRLSG